MRLLLAAPLLALALAGCGVEFKTANFCTGPYATEGYRIAGDGSRVECVATRSFIGAGAR